MVRNFAVIVSVIVFFASFASADTFKHRLTGDVLHGYATSNITGGLTEVHTSEKGLLKLNMAQYSVKSDRNGRNNIVTVITIDDEIALEMETEAFEETIIKESDKGPLFILIEIDTPGGRVDFAKRMCSAIINTRNCRTIAFIKGGQFGGALSAGTAVSFACNEIYMAPETVIGAATMIAVSSSGSTVDLKSVAGETIGEKMGSAWRNYLASLAQQNNRPPLLAKAMEDKDISVIEVTGNSKHRFIEPTEKKSHQSIIRTWSKKGTLLTLPANDAVTCGIADKTASSRMDLLADTDAGSAAISINTALQDARKLYKKVDRKFEKECLSINTRLTELSLVQNKNSLVRVLRELRTDVKELVRLKKRYPDVKISEEELKVLLSEIEGLYKGVKTVR